MKYFNAALIAASVCIFTSVAVGIVLSNSTGADKSVDLKNSGPQAVQAVFVKQVHGRGQPDQEKRQHKTKKDKENKNRSRGIPVLMYHHVGELPAMANAITRDLTVSVSDFIAQVNYLKSNGYNTITTEQLLRLFESGAELPKKPIVITFDDGYRDAFDNAVPILHANKMIGSFAVVTGFVGTNGYASWEQIVRAKELGMEIIPHSYSHMDFTNKKYTREQKIFDVARSIKDLREHLDINSRVFIYPYGHHNSELQEILNAHGFKMAFTVAAGKTLKEHNWLALPRVRVHGHTTLRKFAKNLE